MVFQVHPVWIQPYAAVLFYNPKIMRRLSSFASRDCAGAAPESVSVTALLLAWRQFIDREEK